MKILFEDEYLVVIEKPAGIIVNNAESVKGETIQDWLKDKITIENPESEFAQKGGIVHRLDKDTSGLMVLAKTEQAYEGLKQQFLERKTMKVYLALVHGKFKEKEGVISLPIERHSKNKHKFAIGTDPSRTAITEYKVRKENEDYALVELKLHTGRTHQIRVHMKHLGHPLLSDPIYGGKGYKQDIEFCPRLFLHAHVLQFKHPITGNIESFRSELPTELEQVEEKLLH